MWSVCFVRGGVWCVVCVGVCVLVCAVVYVLRVCVWDVRFVFWCCGVLCCVVMCGVGAGDGVQCVVCGVSGVCAWRVLCVRCGVCGVCGAAWHAENHPCVGSKRLRVYRQNARMCSTCARFASTHGSVLNVHTETFSTNTRRRGKGRRVVMGVLFSLFLSSLLFFSLPALVLSLFSLSNNDNDHSTSWSLCVHTALTCLSVRVPVPWLIPCLANMFISCKKQLSRHNCASLVPLGMKWTCICAGNG